MFCVHFVSIFFQFKTGLKHPLKRSTSDNFADRLSNRYLRLRKKKRFNKKHQMQYYTSSFVTYAHHKIHIYIYIYVIMSCKHIKNIINLFLCRGPSAEIPQINVFQFSKSFLNMHYSNTTMNTFWNKYSNTEHIPISLSDSHSVVFLL